MNIRIYMYINVLVCIHKQINRDTTRFSLRNGVYPHKSMCKKIKTHIHYMYDSELLKNACIYTHIMYMYINKYTFVYIHI